MDEFNLAYVLRSDHVQMLDDKEKQIIDIKGEKTKLEEKLGIKDCELASL